MTLRSFARRAYRSRWLPYSIAAASLNATAAGVLAADGLPQVGLALMFTGCALFAVLCFGGPDG